MTLRERLVSGERVKVQGKYLPTRFYMQRVEASLGVFFLQAFDKDGKCVPPESAMWNSPTCENWINGVRIATVDACHPVGTF